MVQCTLRLFARGMFVMSASAVLLCALPRRCVIEQDRLPSEAEHLRQELEKQGETQGPGWGVSGQLAQAVR